jgi:hypothetical protein
VHELVAGLRGQLAHALAFGAEHQRQRADQIELPDRARRVLGGADDADLALLQLVQGPRQVGDHEVRHRLGGAARHLGDGGVDADRMVLGRHHRMGAGPVGHAQAGAEVVRVGHAVEHQHQRRSFDEIERVVERLGQSQWLDSRHHALVPVRAGELAQAFVAALDELDAGLDRTGDEVLHASVASRRIDVQLEHRARRRPETDAHRMETEQDARRHRWIVAAAGRVSASGRAARPPRPRRPSAPAGASCRR